MSSTNEYDVVVIKEFFKFLLLAGILGIVAFGTALPERRLFATQR